MTHGVESRVAYIRIYILNYILNLHSFVQLLDPVLLRLAWSLRSLLRALALFSPNGGPFNSRGRLGGEGEPGRTLSGISWLSGASWCQAVEQGDQIGRHLAHGIVVQMQQGTSSVRDQAQEERGAEKSAILTCSMASNSSQSWDASGIGRASCRERVYVLV